MLGQNITSYAQNKETRRKKRKERRQWRIDENEDNPQPLCPSEKYHHSSTSPKHSVPSNTSKKGSDDDDTVARIGPRVSPGMQLEVGRGTPDDLKEELRHPHASPCRCQYDKDFSRPLIQRLPATLYCSTKLATHKLTPHGLEVAATIPL